MTHHRLLVLAALLLPAAARAQDTPPQRLHIDILEGEGALNNIRQRTAREPIVQVEDENHKPVAGVLVLFAAQRGGSGASASFSGSSTLTVITGPDGRAVGRGLIPNADKGSFNVQVTATLGQLTDGAVIHEVNTANGKGDSATHRLISNHRNVVVATAVAAGVVVAVLLVKLLGNHGANIGAGTGSVHG